MIRERIAQTCVCCSGARLSKSPAVLMPFVAKRVFDHDPVEITPDWGLRDLRPGMAYSVCNTMECDDCGALFLDIRFSDTEMRALYAGYRDESYTTLRERFEPGYRQINQHLSGRAPYLPSIENHLLQWVPGAPSVLDWGGDTGINTPLKSQAKRVHVYDISGKAPVAGVQAIGLAEARANTYDLITCSQVLEHVPWPADTVRQIVNLMRRETFLYLEVPFEDLMRAQDGAESLRLAKRHWHEHVNFFSKASMRALVRECGLQLVDLTTIEISLQWRQACVMSVLCRLA